MKHVVHWGASAYTTAAELELEQQMVSDLGLGWSEWRDKNSFPPDLARADVLVVSSSVRVDDEVLDSFGGSLILTTTNGYDHLDLARCRVRGIQVARMPLARRDAVVEHSLGMMIALMRRFPSLQRAAEEGQWVRGLLPELNPCGLGGARVAVLGLGVIGRRMAEVLHCFGAEVLGVDVALGSRSYVEEVGRHVSLVSLEIALQQADVVTAHCSLTPSSREILSAEKLAILRQGAIVINTARGSVLDVQTALAMVESGHLAGLAVDVFPVEPYPQLAEGAAVPGVFFSPHSSGYTTNLGANLIEDTKIALSAWLRGDAVPWSLIDGEAPEVVV
ncbi:MAG: hypothetical protein HN348_02885 [Proteobacteria bacterium]|nr:hypothetical protein [Pseudomonadota bacterium]